MYFSAVHRLHYIDIAGRFSTNGHQTRVEKTRYFLSKCINITKTIGDMSKVTINEHLHSPMAEMTIQ